jgi:hypothetical protein
VSGSNARLKRDQAVEQVALHIFGTIDTGGQLITRRLVRDHLDELAGHRDGCRCGLCRLLPSVTETRVWRTASRWQSDVNRTRLLARR